MLRWDFNHLQQIWDIELDGSMLFLPARGRMLLSSFCHDFSRSKTSSLKSSGLANRTEGSFQVSNLSMEVVEKYFGTPKTPVPTSIPSWEIPVPATLGKLSYLKLYDILIDHPCSQGLYRIQTS